jgi:hypothetical protein
VTLDFINTALNLIFKINLTLLNATQNIYFRGVESVATSRFPTSTLWFPNVAGKLMV